MHSTGVIIENTHVLMKNTILTLFAALLVGMPMKAGDIYVSPAGNDLSAGTSASPLRTPAAALKLAREWRRLQKKDADGGINIHLEGGVYQLTKPLFLRPEDSGTAASPTIISADATEAAVISGGQPLKGWTRGCTDSRVPQEIRGRVWVADAPMAGNRIVYCRQLWVNGHKAVRAQQGKYGEMTRMKDFDVKSHTITIPTPQEDLSGARELEMTVHQRWAIAILRVKEMKNLGNGLTQVSFYEPESQLEFAHPWPQPVIDGEKGSSSYFLSNAPQLLDEPGEWYQDYPSGKIYYLPREDEDMAKAEAIVPVLENLLTVDGTRERTVHDIQFRNITFSHAAWTRPLTEGLVTLQGGFRMIDAYKLPEPGLPEKASLENQAWIARPEAAITVRHAQGIDFRKCRFEHLGATALDYETAVSRSTVSGSRFTDIGGNAMLIGHFPDGGFETHVPYKPAVAGDLCDNITISDNEVCDATNEDWGCVGIGAGYVSNINISNNEVHHVNYSGICVGWGWTPRESGMCNNRIIANYVHDFGRQLYDVGGIYTLSYQPNSEIRYNRIEDLCEAPYATNERAFYIYFDEATDGYTVTDNWCPKELFGYNQPGPKMVIKGNGPKVDRRIKEKAGLKKQENKK